MLESLEAAVGLSSPVASGGDIFPCVLTKYINWDLLTQFVPRPVKGGWVGGDWGGAICAPVSKGLSAVGDRVVFIVFAYALGACKAGQRCAPRGGLLHLCNRSACPGRPWLLGELGSY